MNYNLGKNINSCECSAEIKTKVTDLIITLLDTMTFLGQSPMLIYVIIYSDMSASVLYKDLFRFCKLKISNFIRSSSQNLFAPSH